MSNTSYLERSDGRIAFTVSSGNGPLVVCVPGMGEVRASYRLLVPLLTDRGYRVAVMDLRGHGDSDASFNDYDDVALAGDILALIDELGGPAYVVGNSMGAGAGVIAAADAPDQVSGLALLSPFVRNPQTSAMQKLLTRLLFTKPWGPAAFLSYYPKWYPGEKPEDFTQHLSAVRENLSKPGHWPAFVQTTRTSHAPAEQRLPQVTAPTVVVMGAADIDWPNPAAEAEWIGNQLGGDVVMAPGVGHYPQAQAPTLTADAVVRLIEGDRA
jgi:pimeloyl-ACP methyl ester carboxylesterase